MEIGPCRNISGRVTTAGSGAGQPEQMASSSSGAHPGKIEACANGVVRKAGVVLDPADALLGHGKKEFAIPSDARGGIMHLRIVKSEGNH